MDDFPALHYVQPASQQNRAVDKAFRNTLTPKQLKKWTAADGSEQREEVEGLPDPSCYPWRHSLSDHCSVCATGSAKRRVRNAGGDEEAEKTRLELEKAHEEERKNKRKLEFQKTLASRIQAARVKTEKEYENETGFSRPSLTLPSTQKRSSRGAGGGAVRGALTGPGTSSTGGGTSSTANAAQVAAARMREIPTPTPAAHAESVSIAPSSAAVAPAAAAPVEPSSQVANADAVQVPPDWVPPECPTYLALDSHGPNHECPVCGHNSIHWEAHTMPSGFMKPWLRCTRYPHCAFAYSPRRGVLPDKRRRDKRH
ncbi:unnamed protein product [Symbiodinium microadriaticum]|nr:unnamed protein product [Symbiodinium microadriaticum]